MSKLSVVLRVLYILAISVSVFILVEVVVRAFSVSVPLAHGWLLTEIPTRSISDRYIFERLDVPKTMDEHAKRVAVIGDSFSECGFIKDVVCFSDIIATKSGSIRVYNYAAAGMNTDQQLKYFKERILPLHPDIVIWQMYVNDIWENVILPLYTLSPAGTLQDEPAVHNWAYRRQLVYQRLPYRNIVLRSTIVRAAFRLFELNLYAQAPRVSDDELLLWSLRKVQLEVKEMNNLAQANGFHVIYVNIPPQAAYLSTGTPKDMDVWRSLVKTYRQLDSVLSNEASYAPVSFDLDAKSEEGSGEQAADIFYTRSDANALGDKHLNTKGQEVIAKRIMNTIHSLVPEISFVLQ